MEKLEFVNNNIKYEVIATYHDEESNKDFIVYTDKTLDENKKLRVYYSLYKMVDNKIILIEPKTTNDKKIGLELIKEIVNNFK